MKKRIFLLIFSPAIFIFIFLFPAKGIAVDKYAPTFVRQAPKIDGILNEAIWSSAFEVIGLKKIDPDTKESPSLRTRFKLLYDENALYIGVINEQSAETLIQRISARDRDIIKRDAVQIVLDPSGQGLYGYTFEVALGGSLSDGTVRPPKIVSLNWDCPWQAMTTSDDKHWYAEIRIPWDTMEFPGQKTKRSIGIFLRREVAHLGEIWAKPAISVNSDVYLSAFNKMTVDNISPGGRITFYPYVAVEYDNVSHKRSESLGTDVFWQPSSNVLVSATVNPDFGDVESDDIVVNFNNTEIYIQDKRSFFVERNDIFKTHGLNLVHTRRIGETPDRPKLSESERIIRSPNISDILVAAKLTGQKDRLRFGIMSAFEDKNDFTVSRPSEGITYELAEDGRNFYTARGLFETDVTDYGYFSLGYLGTFTDKFSYNAWVHSLDGVWRTMNKKFRLELQAATSDVDEERGYAWNGKAMYHPDPNTDVWLELDYIDDTFDINDMGYMLRNNRLRYHLEYRANRYNLSKLKGLSWKLEAFGSANDHLLDSKIGGAFFPKFHNLTKAYAEIYYIPAAWNDLNSYGHGVYRTKAGYHIYFSWYSDESKPLHVYLNPAVFTEDNGGVTRKLRIRIKLTPADRWILESDMTYYDREDWILWSSSNSRMNGFDADYVTADIYSNYKLARNQELRIGVQWVGIDATGKTVYDIGPDGRLNPIAYGDEAEKSSFDYSQFVGQIRYKFEFAPLSDLFIVYNRGGLLRRGEGIKEDNLGDLLIDSIEEKDVDQFIVKIRYRF